MRLLHLTIFAALAFGVAACSGERTSNPDHTATEQLLITKAADDAVAKLHLPLKAGQKVFLDATGVTGDYAPYATALVRDRILLDGGHLVPDRAAADIVVEARSGALSIDEFQSLIGLPESKIPVPLAGDLSTPEMALYKRAERRGIAKLGLTAYDAKGGGYVGGTGTKFGFSQKKEWTVLFFISWGSEDYIPPGVEPSRQSVE